MITNSHTISHDQRKFRDVTSIFIPIQLVSCRTFNLQTKKACILNLPEACSNAIRGFCHAWLFFLDEGQSIVKDLICISCRWDASFTSNPSDKDAGCILIANLQVLTCAELELQSGTCCVRGCAVQCRSAPTSMKQCMQSTRKEAALLFPRMLMGF